MTAGIHLDVQLYEKVCIFLKEVWQAGRVRALSHLPFHTSDLELLKRGNKCRSGNEGCEKVHQTDSNPGPHN